MLSGCQSGVNTLTLFDGVVNVAKEEARRLRGVERAVGLEVSIDIPTLPGQAINGPRINFLLPKVYALFCTGSART